MKVKKTLFRKRNFFAATLAAIMLTIGNTAYATEPSVNGTSTFNTSTLSVSVGAERTYSTSSVSFPLSEYPNGSYYSLTGVACSCHGGSLGNPCYWDNSCDCINFDNSIQCAAFAKYIFYLAKGYHYSSGSRTTKNVSLTSTTAKSNLRNLSQGTYIRVLTNNGYEHSLAIVGTSSTGITVYHANYGGSCKVNYKTYTWANFASAFPYLYYYVV